MADHLSGDNVSLLTELEPLLQPYEYAEWDTLTGDSVDDPTKKRYWEDLG